MHLLYLLWTPPEPCVFFFKIVLLLKVVRPCEGVYCRSPAAVIKWCCSSTSKSVLCQNIVGLYVRKACGIQDRRDLCRCGILCCHLRFGRYRQPSAYSFFIFGPVEACYRWGTILHCLLHLLHSCTQWPPTKLRLLRNSIFEYGAEFDACNQLQPLLAGSCYPMHIEFIAHHTIGCG